MPFTGHVFLLSASTCLAGDDTFGLLDAVFILIAL